MLTFVSFYTPSYAKFVSDWESDMSRWGLDHLAIARRPAGSWQGICYDKPVFLSECMDEHLPGRPLCWVDIDARIRRRPVQLIRMPTPVDFAYTITKATSQPYLVQKRGYEDGRIVAGGTLYFSGSIRSRMLLQWWIMLCGQRDYYSDQQVLTEAFREHAPEHLSSMKLPHSYCETRPAARGAVIEHLCAGAATLAKQRRGRDLSRRYTSKRGPH
jgi:hypothetical protein